ncbi:hypothetical protein ACJX0J_015500, partial [Zea mays]
MIRVWYKEVTDLHQRLPVPWSTTASLTPPHPPSYLSLPSPHRSAELCRTLASMRLCRPLLHPSAGSHEQLLDRALPPPRPPPSPEVFSLIKTPPTLRGRCYTLLLVSADTDEFQIIHYKILFKYYAEFRNTGLERSEALKNDLEWFRQQGHTIPKPSAPGTTYASLLEDLSEEDPQAFICHFYNVYFAHTAGGRMIGKNVSEKILNNKELEFYKWEGNLSQLLQNVRNKLNQVAS